MLHGDRRQHAHRSEAEHRFGNAKLAAVVAHKHTMPKRRRRLSEERTFSCNFDGQRLNRLNGCSPVSAVLLLGQGEQFVVQFLLGENPLIRSRSGLR